MLRQRPVLEHSLLGRALSSDAGSVGREAACEAHHSTTVQGRHHSTTAETAFVCDSSWPTATTAVFGESWEQWSVIISE